MIYVGRPTIWGNPFRADRFGHMSSVQLYRHWVAGELGAHTLERLKFSPAEIDALWRWRTKLLARLPELIGRDLQCWCPLNGPCHGNELLRLAAQYAEYERCCL